MIEKAIESWKNIKSVRISLGKMHINKVKDKNRNDTTNREEILNTENKFYKNIYEEKQMAPVYIKNFLKKKL